MESNASPAAAAIYPATPGSAGVRRSSRLLSSTPGSTKRAKEVSLPPVTPSSSRKARRALDLSSPSIDPDTPNRPEKRRRRNAGRPRKKVFYKKVIYDGGEFAVGDDVYIKRKEGSESDSEDPEFEECKVCFKPASKTKIMIECDDCLGGFHLRCVKPPLKKIPEGDWICNFCSDLKNGKVVSWPKPPEGKKVKRTLKEKLLSSDLWAARIESLWRETDGTYWLRCRWYTIPEETTAGRQPHNLRRELYRTNDFCDTEMECVVRHCYVLSPKEFKEANDSGDDVFYCEYEYDINWHNFKRISEIDDDSIEGNGGENGEDSEFEMESSSDCSDEDSEYEKEEKLDSPSSKKNRSSTLAANSRKGRVIGLQKIGARKIPEHVRCHKQTDLEKAKAALLLASLPKSPPCRNKEMEEIRVFVKGAIGDLQCLGRCLYIHGVPGTGKTMSVLNVMRSLKSEVDSGALRPYCFIEINGLKLASPENIYKVIYEQLSGNRVGWKKALHNLNEHFSNGNNNNNKSGKKEHKPIVLLIDELDLLLTRNQSVLYNILDWPTRPNSKLVVIGIANTMDLPEKLLPRISSRMGIQRLCFGPYNYKQLQEIISSRLSGINAFEDQAIEFASRKVAAMSGDARRALEICRRAAELADFRIKQSVSTNDASSSVENKSKGKYLVSMSDIDLAIQEVFQAPHIQTMKNCTKLGKIVLVAMVHELYRSELGEVTFEKLASKVINFCLHNREELPGYDTLMRVCCKLGESKIILCEDGTKHRLQKLQLNYPSDDVAFALKECKEVPWLSMYL
ncbi:hypothetical protein LUZ60_006376 [Juncus effusus]|nr:hypothetical protein LUZ60_006376 [Juncus effusus]